MPAAPSPMRASVTKRLDQATCPPGSTRFMEGIGRPGAVARPGPRPCCRTPRNPTLLWRRAFRNGLDAVGVSAAANNEPAHVSSSTMLIG